MSPYPFQENQDDSQSYQYNDYDGYFSELVDDKPLKIKKNVPVIKNIKKLIDEYFTIAQNEEVQRIRKEDIIIEIAENIETIYRNSNLDHLVETIAATVCLILTKKDSHVTARWIYQVLEKKFKSRYSSFTGADRRNDTYSKRNVLYNEIYVALAELPDKLKECFAVIEKEKHDELKRLFDYVTQTQLNLELEYGTPKTKNESFLEEEHINPQKNNYYDFPTTKTSLYYDRLGEYISILQKVRENVLKFPPSPKLDLLLDESLALEIELLMPSVDMKYKRSIPQLDETVRHANIQSLGGASSVMKEPMLIPDIKGEIIDPNDRLKRFTQKFHKLAPEQIEIRKGYISNIRKKISKYNPHLFYNIIWYEGSDLYDHKLSMGKFARSPIKKD